MPKKVDDFLLKEYETARDLTFEVDELRNKLSTFYAGFATVAFAGLGLFVKSGPTTSDVIVQLGWTLPVILVVLGCTGALLIIALAKLRSVQLEHFRIMNNFREYFIEKDVELWNVVELSRTTLPKPGWKSGSFMWVAMVITLSATVCGSAAFAASKLLFVDCAKWPIAFVACLLVWLVEYRLYFTNATEPSRRVYTESPF
jgi:hypothetical protein